METNYISRCVRNEQKEKLKKDDEKKNIILQDLGPAPVTQKNTNFEIDNIKRYFC